MKTFLIPNSNMLVKRSVRLVVRFSHLTPYEDKAFNFKSRTDAYKPVKKEMGCIR